MQVSGKTWSNANHLRAVCVQPISADSCSVSARDLVLLPGVNKLCFVSAIGRNRALLVYLPNCPVTGLWGLRLTRSSGGCKASPVQSSQRLYQARFAQKLRWEDPDLQDDDFSLLPFLPLAFLTSSPFPLGQNPKRQKSECVTFEERHFQTALFLRASGTSTRRVTL